MNKYTFSKDFGNIDVARNSFNELAQATFGISFEEWKNKGYWGSNYIPYAWLDEGKIIANISVNTMELLFHGKPVKAVQLGTVMTDVAFRNQGLSRQLMERILEEYQDKCDFFYLFANKTVLNFYPRFGFQRVWEYRSSAKLHRNPVSPGIRKIDMCSTSDRAIFLRLVNHSLPFAKISMIGNPGLIMFYCDFYLKDNLYYIPEMDIAAVAETKGNTLLLQDIFSEKVFDLNTVVNALLPYEEMKVVFGFTPPNSENLKTESETDDNSALFVKTVSGFHLNKERFPVLSHA